MTRRIIVGLGVLVMACAKRSTTPAPVVTASTVSTTERATRISGETDVFRSVSTTESFSPGTGAEALKNFVAEVKPDESGGECSFTRTRGNGALTATAFYPTRAGSKMQIILTFDSIGHVVHYTEMRGVIHMKPGLRIDQLDSARRAIEATLRTTSINFDYPVDRALAMNRGAGRPTVAIMASVREMEGLDNLQQPAARMERMRKLCGV